MPQIQRPLITNADTREHRGFLLAEDEALKQHLSGITVPDVRPGKEGESTEMGVWYRFPEGERQIKYPFATIDMLSIEPRFDLFTSDHSMDPRDTYWPSTYPGPAPLPPTKMGWHIEPFLPFQIVYQVAVHSRSAAHDRYLTSLFTTDVFQPRPWWLMVDADNTYRRTELLSFNAADLAETTESGTKRIFRKVWTISMQAEIPQQPLFEWDGDGLAQGAVALLPGPQGSHPNRGAREGGRLHAVRPLWPSRSSQRSPRRRPRRTLANSPSSPTGTTGRTHAHLWSLNQCRLARSTYS